MTITAASGMPVRGLSCKTHEQGARPLRFGNHRAHLAKGLLQASAEAAIAADAWTSMPRLT